MPIVSVIIPTYKRHDSLRVALKSVFCQTFEDFEIIVVDDGVDQPATAVIAEYTDTRLRYIQHTTSQGGAVARNTGIAAATGKYIAFLDDDDRWLPEKLALQTAALEATDRQVSAVFCGVAICDSTGHTLREVVVDTYGVYQPYEQTLKKCFIWTSAFMYKKWYADKGFIFDTSLKKNQEWDLQLRLLPVSSFFSINKPLVCIVDQGDEGHMGAKTNVKNQIDGMLTFIQRHQAEYIARPDAYALRYMSLAQLYLIDDDFIQARQSVYRAWRLQPLRFVYLRHLVAMSFGKTIYEMLKQIINR